MIKQNLILILAGFIMLITLKADKEDSFFPYNVHKKVLENGLTVYAIPSPTQGIVSFYSIVRTGARDEWEDGYSGFAHFFEHMMFRGTKKYPGNVYDSLTIAMGANANAYTTDDYTCYHLSFTKDNLERVIELESDRFQNLFYAEDAFKTEAGAVYGEYRKGKTNPFFVIYEKLMETAFDKHTYKHTTIGFEKDIAAMPTMYDYSIAFFNRYYRPENVILVAVGDIQPENVFGTVEKYYREWKQGYVQPKITPEPEQTAPRYASVTYPGKTLPIIAIAFKGLAYEPNNSKFIASNLVADLLFGETSELYKKLYLKEHKVQVLEPDFEYNRDPKLNALYVQLNNEKDIDYVIDEIDKTIDFFKTNPIELKKLENLKKRMKYSYLMQLETPDRIAGSLARIIAVTGGIDGINQFYKTLEQVTVNDVQLALQSLFIPERRTIITLKGEK